MSLFPCAKRDGGLKNHVAPSPTYSGFYRNHPPAPLAPWGTPDWTRGAGLSVIAAGSPGVVSGVIKGQGGIPSLPTFYHRLSIFSSSY